MELKLIALTLFVLILIYFNYRRYKRMERQRAILHQARNGLIFESSTAGSYPRSINITTRSNPRHQIAIIFPGSDLNYQSQTEANNNGTGSGAYPSQIHPDLPPSYYDLFSESELKGAGSGVCSGSPPPPSSTNTNTSTNSSNSNSNPLPPPPPPTYGQIMSDGAPGTENNARTPPAAPPGTNSATGQPPAPERY